MATGSVDLGVRGLHEIEMIGAGGSAIVYKAVRHDPDRSASEEIVAVKVLRSAWDTTALRRFEREQRVMNRLSETAGFVPIIETGEAADGSPYIIMPYYHGGSLQQRISRHGPLDWPRAVRLVEEVADTLAEAHQIDVFHRDIKPANILLTEKGRPHIADFGISLIADDTASQATATAAFTPAYSPPESFIDGLRPVATTDVYGLAATLWALLAGHAPFKQPGERPTPVTVFGRVAIQQVGDLRESVPSPICRFIELAMAKQPEDRPQSMNDFLAGLQAGREDAFRGVEVERLEIEPFLEEAAVAKLTAAATEADGGFRSEFDLTDETAAIPIDPDDVPVGGPLSADAGTPPSADRIEVSSSTETSSQAEAWNQGDPSSEQTDGPAVTGSVAVGEIDDVDTQSAAPELVQLDTETAPIFRPSAEEERADLGWLGKVAVAAAITVLILLLGWWVLRPGADSGAEVDSARIEAGQREAAVGSATDADGQGRSTSDNDGDRGSSAPLDGSRSSVVDDVTDDKNESAEAPRSTLSPVPQIGRDGRPGASSTTARPRPSATDPAAPTTGQTASSSSSSATSALSTTTSSSTTTVLSTTTSTSLSSTSEPSASTPIAFVGFPNVVSSSATNVVFAYQTNDVCGTGSFEFVEADTGQSIGQWSGDRTCLGPLYNGESRWPGLTLDPGTTYLVHVTVEGMPTNGILASGTGKVSTSFQVTTPDG